MDLLHNSFYGLDDTETKVWSHIRFVGKADAISGRAIAKKTKLTYKRVQEIVSHLVVEHGKFIGSCTKGFFVPQTQEELRDSTRVLRHRGIMNFVRAAKLEKVSPYKLFKQSMIEFEKEVAA